MNMVKIYPVTDCDGIVIEYDGKLKVVTRSLLAILSNIEVIINSTSNSIPIDHSSHSCQGLERITSYDDVSALFKNEDLKALIEANKYRTIPAFDIVKDKLDQINAKINIDDITYISDKGIYKYWLSNGQRKCGIEIEKDFCSDLADNPDSATSSYSRELESKLTQLLLTPIEKAGLIEYSKNTLKELLLNHLKELLKTSEHVNKYNVIGKPIRGAEGMLERSLHIFLSDGERANAGLAIEELIKQGILIPTYKDLISPQDWIKINPSYKPQNMAGGAPMAMQKEKGKYVYEVVISCAGEDRKHAQKLAEMLRQDEIKVFYDEFEEEKLWGKNLYDYLSDIYKNQGRYCVMFLSKHYAEKVWPNHERQSAQDRAFNENKEYILPIKIDDTEIPGILSTVAYQDIRSKSIEDIYKVLKNKLQH
jgi:hypothetical protein